MKRLNTLITRLLLMSLALSAAAQPVAYKTFTGEETDVFDGTPYHWLGRSPLEITLDLKPGPGHAIDLLLGAKQDTRYMTIDLNGHTLHIQNGGYEGYEWKRISVPKDITGNKYTIKIRPNEGKPAFIAALRIGPAVAALPPGTSLATIGKPQLPMPPPPSREVPTFDHLPSLERNAAQANQALKQCRQYVDGWLNHADPISGLIPRNLRESKTIWNGKDSAADNYPFMVMTCALTDNALYQGSMRDMLESEIRLTRRIGNLVDVFSFPTQSFAHETPSMDRILFDSSEYAKDGLIPLTELLGKTPWRDRLLGIIDDIIAHAAHPTANGPIPLDNVEVNGELMQMLGRLYWMTGNDTYLDMGVRIADYYLLGGNHPTRDMTTLSLDDHGCELISGLCEIYVTCRYARPGEARAFKQPLYDTLDTILELAVNKDGFLHHAINPVEGKVTKEALSDNWGYNYNGFYAVYLMDGVERYRDIVLQALRSLDKPKYLAYPWEGFGSDGIADVVEGALNLYNRESVPEAEPWIDANVHRMLGIQKEDGVIEGWHGDGNFARTAIMWALWKQQGATLHPWREDVTLGAIKTPNGIRLRVAAQEPWQGVIKLDPPRHKTIMNMPLDYPRINQFPEWFTVSEGKEYAVGGQTIPGEELLEGLPFELTAGQAIEIDVSITQKK